MPDKPHTKPPIALEERGALDGRLFSPSAGRNKGVVAEALRDFLPEKSRVLEIASGTGEHGMAALNLRPDLHWQYSDPDPASRASQRAWLRAGKYDFPAPRALDVTSQGWANDLPKFDAIFCANMIHIAPWSAAEGLAEGAAKCVIEGGIVCLYGPFLEGANSEPSNLAFDVTLKDRNPAWGVRELDSVKHIFAKHGFNRFTRRDMPKNNLFWLISRS
jgi:hypothetical protein